MSPAGPDRLRRPRRDGRPARPGDRRRRPRARGPRPRSARRRAGRRARCRRRARRTRRRRRCRGRLREPADAGRRARGRMRRGRTVHGRGDPHVRRPLDDRRRRRGRGRRVARRRGIDVLDAPVSGGVAGATARTLAVMAAGDERVFERVRPLLDTFGGSVFHVGSVPGQGQTVEAPEQPPLRDRARDHRRRR